MATLSAMPTKSTIGAFVLIVAAGIVTRLAWELIVAPRIPETIP